MCSAVDFLPQSMTLLMKRASTFELNFGSGRICRFGAGPLRGITSSSRAWRRTWNGRACGIERAANDVVANSREILDATTADEDHRVLLKIVTDARDIGGDLLTIG